MKIGELANLLSVSTDTLRYYEKNGLLTCHRRSEKGYRLYDAHAVAQLKFVLRAKQVGFTLNEIKELLAINLDKSNHSCAEVKTLTEQKMAEINKRMNELMRFQKSLSLLHDSCCGGNEPAEHCSILSALEDIDGTD